MRWPEAEQTIADYITAQWALGAYSSMPLVFEHIEQLVSTDTYMYVAIEGVLSEKTIFGGPGARSSLEMGIVYYHAFQTAPGKITALGAVDTMTEILELRTLSGQIKFDGANPPSPATRFDATDRELPAGQQPGGNYYRVSGSVPFIVIDAR